MPNPSCPATREKIADLYFLEHRAKALDLAAFLDRLDRAAPGADAGAGEDFRIAALRGALEILVDGQPDRARRVLELWSDPTTEPIPAASTKGASGAYAGANHEGRP